MLATVLLGAGRAAGYTAWSRIDGNDGDSRLGDRSSARCCPADAPGVGTLAEIGTPFVSGVTNASAYIVGNGAGSPDCRLDKLSRARSKKDISKACVGAAGEAVDRDIRDSAERLRRRPLEPKVSVVIPAKNEARNLEIVLPKLPPVHEVILVDGHSVDDTVNAARRVMPAIRVVTQTRLGKGNALACGFEAASGDIIVMFDADGSADPNEIELFLDALRSGADFAKGSRFRPGGGSADITRFRRYGNTGLNFVARMLIGTRYTDLCYGYNAFWADVKETLSLPDTHLTTSTCRRMWGDGFEIETVINCRIAAAKLAVVEVPSFERCRLYGASNLRVFSDGARVLKTLLAERRRARRAQLSQISDTRPALVEEDTTSAAVVSQASQAIAEIS